MRRCANSARQARPLRPTPKQARDLARRYISVSSRLSTPIAFYFTS
jgi:hypothetical protein